MATSRACAAPAAALHAPRATLLRRAAAAPPPLLAVQGRLPARRRACSPTCLATPPPFRDSTHSADDGGAAVAVAAPPAPAPAAPATRKKTRVVVLGSGWGAVSFVKNLDPAAFGGEWATARLGAQPAGARSRVHARLVAPLPWPRPLAAPPPPPALLAAPHALPRLRPPTQRTAPTSWCWSAPATTCSSRRCCPVSAAERGGTPGCTWAARSGGWAACRGARRAAAAAARARPPHPTAITPHNKQARWAAWCRRPPSWSPSETSCAARWAGRVAAPAACAGRGRAAACALLTCLVAEPPHPAPSQPASPSPPHPLTAGHLLRGQGHRHRPRGPPHHLRQGVLRGGRGRPAAPAFTLALVLLGSGLPAATSAASGG